MYCGLIVFLLKWCVRNGFRKCVFSFGFGVGWVSDSVVYRVSECVGWVVINV